MGERTKIYTIISALLIGTTHHDDKRSNYDMEINALQVDVDFVFVR